MVAILLQFAAIMVGMRKFAAILALLLWPILVLGQTGAYSGHTFVGGVPATTSGMNSSNYMDGIIPGASITVYLTGTTTKATIYEDGSNTPLSNPFFSNLAPGTNPGGFIFWSAQNQGLDIQAQGGMGNASCTTPPLCYPTATTLQVDVYPNNSFTPIIVPYPGVTSPGTGGLAGINWALYPCTGNATTDLFMINTYLATPGTYLYLFGNCATNNQIILFSNDTLDWTGQTITSSMPYSPDGNGVDEAAITNEAVVNPTTVGPFSCALTAGSPLVSCSTANFTNADQNQSFVCTGALGGGVDLHTSIEGITSGTSLYLYDAAGSTITSGDFNCTEQIRDHDIHILAGTLSMTSVYDTPFVSPHEVLIGHVNRLDMEDGYWIEPDGSSNWHMALFDISDTIVHGTHHYSASGFGQDGVHFLGPARNISVDSVVCNTYDDCVAMQTSLSSGTFHNTNGSISAWSIHNIQGIGGSAGVALYDNCVNASGTCINSPLSNGVIDTVLAGPEGGAVNGNGFNDPVRIGYIQEAASDIGTVAQIDNISINHIKGANYYSEDQIAIGSATVNEYYGTISISDVAPIIHASGGDNGSVKLRTPPSPYTLNIGTLAVNDLGYTSSLLPLVNTAGNTAAITNFYADNPNAIYRIWGAVTNKYIAGILVPGTTPVSGGTNTYLLYDNNHFLGEEAATTNILTDWSNNVGSASANQMIPFCSSVASLACTGFTLEELNTSALLD